MTRLEDSVVQNLGSETIVEVQDVVKLEERMCYDALWQVNTNIGDFLLKTYDGISKSEMLKQCKSINTINQLNDLQPRCFYYD